MCCRFFVMLIHEKSIQLFEIHLPHAHTRACARTHSRSVLSNTTPTKCSFSLYLLTLTISLVTCRGTHAHFKEPSKL